MARCMLLETQLGKELWAYAVMASAYIRNRWYNPRTGKTPYEAMRGRKPDLSKMHIFGTTCYEVNNTHSQNKLQNAVDDIQEWATDNNMSLNTNKTK